MVYRQIEDLLKFKIISQSPLSHKKSTIDTQKKVKLTVTIEMKKKNYYWMRVKTIRSDEWL